MATNKRFRNDETRGLLALAIAMDPQAAGPVRQLLKMGAYEIRHDWMFVRNATGAYDRIPDPTAFNATLDAFGGKANMGVCLLRSKDGTWFLNGQ